MTLPAYAIMQLEMWWRKWRRKIVAMSQILKSKCIPVHVVCFEWAEPERRLHEELRFSSTIDER